MLRIHAYGLRLTPEEVPARSLHDDVADLECFRAVVAALRARGDAVAIASFGRFDVIAAYMERICPGAFSRASISTPSCVGVADGFSVPGGKTPQLEALADALLPLRAGESPAARRERVLFLDDDAKNVQARRARLRACTPRACADALP